MSRQARSPSVRAAGPRVALADASPVLVSHWRYAAAHVYDIEVHEATGPAHARGFVAHAVKVRSDADRPVSVDAQLQPEYGATRFEAFTKIEAAVEKWVERQAAVLTVAHP